ncbi:MAG: hypothetical protein QOJ53_2091 [Sphingomonadales bacterium]|nr:hypothetical protein [Sphingomonadales bacterium]
MSTYLLSKAEKDLFDAIEHGDPVEFGRDCEDRTIRSEVLRHFVLGLPVVDEEEGIFAAASSLLRGPPPGKRCRVTGVGISIRGAIIQGRLTLDSAIGEAGAPICPLRFSKCRFDGGFSGRHARFSRLSFARSRFRDPPVRGCIAPAPTVDLTGATIGSSLVMRRVRPDRATDTAEAKADYLWIRALGARIDGEVDLSYSRLRAPPERRDRPLSEPPICGLDLSLARINGDVQFLNGARSEGAIYARGAIIRGDVWMSGAVIEGGEKYALFFQSAEIGGSLMLDGRSKDAARRGDCQLFKAFGQVNLNDLQLGGTLTLSNVQLRPPKPGRDGGSAPRPAAADTSGPADETKSPDDGADPADFACLRLDDARVGDSVLIEIVEGERSRLYGQLYLHNLEVKNALTITDAFLGMPLADPREAIALYAPFLRARQVTIGNVEPLLWEEGGAAPRPDMMGLSVNLAGAKVESLAIADSWLNGHFCAPALKCAGDLALDARIGGSVDLRGAEIGGSLDIAELRLDEGAKGFDRRVRRLDLRDATIARTLSLTMRDRAVRDGSMQLVKARRVALASLRSIVLMECLWRCKAASGRSQVLQTGFLFRGEGAFLLDGKQASFDSVVGHFGHCFAEAPAVADPEPGSDPEPASASASDPEPAPSADAQLGRAIEFVRLYCAYVRTDRPRIMITDPRDAPPFVEAALAADTARPGTLSAGAEGGITPWARVKKQPFADLAPDLLKPVAVSNRRDEFTVSGYCLSGSALVRTKFRLRTGANPVQIKLLEEKPVRDLEKMPCVDGQFVCHPAGIDPGKHEGWIMPPAVTDMEPVADKDLHDLEARLVHHVRSSCSIHGTADLTGLVCGMLDDNSGRAWGTEAILPMNHFVYSRTTWIGRDAEDPTTFGKGTWRSIRVAAARRLPLWLIDLFNLNERLRRSSRYCTGWQARLNWIYRQFDTHGLPSPSRYPITQANYSPQPFEQAIKVCRAEGREDYAIEFEIVKQKIEWRLFNRRNWARFLIVGLVAAVIWLASTHVDTPDRVPIAFALAIGIWMVSYVASFALRIMFGYLRKPVRAIGSLVAAFLIGWGGVHVANDRHLLVVDVAPVAGLVQVAGERSLMASQNAKATDNPIHHVHCGGSISEALYALDVLIPLIDLREESRCEVGRANDYRRDHPFSPNWVARLPGASADSERFWSAAKAVYAIAGWFLVSLSILTFAHVNRARVEPS